MNRNIRILIVEDDGINQANYKKMIEIFNEERGGQFDEPVWASTLGEAEAALNSHHSFDAAIVDLKLKGDSDDDSEGNTVVEDIISSRRFPVFIYSGFPGDIDPEFKESIFLKKYEKLSVKFSEILQEIESIFSSGITRILGKDGQIEKWLHDIFWNHFADSFHPWISGGDTHLALSRYILTHAQEYLETTSDRKKFEKLLPEEMYISPPIRKFPFTGDIWEENENKERFILLTPACDMAQKPKTVVLAEIEKLEAIPRYGEAFERLLEQYKSPPLGTDTQAHRKYYQDKEILSQIMKNTAGNRFHYLPKTSNFDGGVINFQKLRSIDISTLPNEYTSIATVTMPFTKDIIARFSYYYSRQGAPDIDIMYPPRQPHLAKLAHTE